MLKPDIFQSQGIMFRCQSEHFPLSLSSGTGQNSSHQSLVGSQPTWRLTHSRPGSGLLFESILLWQTQSIDRQAAAQSRKQLSRFRKKEGKNIKSKERRALNDAPSQWNRWTEAEADAEAGQTMPSHKMIIISVNKYCVIIGHRSYPRPCYCAVIISNRNPFPNRSRSVTRAALMTSIMSKTHSQRHLLDWSLGPGSLGPWVLCSECKSSPDYLYCT